MSISMKVDSLTTVLRKSMDSIEYKKYIRENNGIYQIQYNSVKEFVNDMRYHWVDIEQETDKIFHLSMKVQGKTSKFTVTREGNKFNLNVSAFDDKDVALSMIKAYNDNSSIKWKLIKKVDTKEEIVVTTIYKDTLSLISMLKSCGASIEKEEESFVKAKLFETEFEYNKNKDGVFILRILATSEEAKDITSVLHLMDNEYSSCVQNKIKNKIVQDARLKGYVVESQKTDNEGNVVVVLNTF